MSRLLLATLAIASVFALTASASPTSARQYRQGNVSSSGPYDRYCLQGRIWGYPGNCQFASYDQCLATASGTDAYCGINPVYAFARDRAYRGGRQPY
ncbi:DUF3551 domain-containing protein [Bradyrhizobium sp. CCGB12]|uniref:DUF3551 domain-containing protein n=1 Tax=Bradyrhizobium sp. CCGB12 TaxID=2949632 RepID=UPI0020B353DD|nr:DUF3551 domain-containing protein [Bradyrhizobium sp. CCGB12]MCP3392391.1 DUF3551 domain-containing protein [Bradyrhizobium sp. CCGB12]